MRQGVRTHFSAAMVAGLIKQTQNMLVIKTYIIHVQARVQHISTRKSGWTLSGSGSTLDVANHSLLV